MMSADIRHEKPLIMNSFDVTAKARLCLANHCYVDALFVHHEQL